MYPGYEPDEVTPLPQPCLAREILSTVIDAQQDLRKKVRNFGIRTEFLSNISAISRGGGLLPEKFGRGVRPASQNPYPIYDQNLRFSLP